MRRRESRKRGLEWTIIPQEQANDNLIGCSSWSNVSLERERIIPVEYGGPGEKIEVVNGFLHAHNIGVRALEVNFKGCENMKKKA